MKKILFLSAFLIWFLIGAACSPKVSLNGESGNNTQSAPEDYRLDALAGQIGGEPWIFVYGTARPDYFDATKLVLHMNNQAPAVSDVCSSQSSDKSVVTSVPASVGEIKFGLDTGYTLTFSIQSPGQSLNLISTDGRIKITEITASYVSGYLIATVDDHHVNGFFKLNVCPR